MLVLVVFLLALLPHQTSSFSQQARIWKGSQHKHVLVRFGLGLSEDPTASCCHARASELFKSELGVSDAQMSKKEQRADKKGSGTTLTLPDEVLERRIQFFRNKNGPFGFSDAELQKIVVAQPTILGLRRETLRSKIRHLCDILGVDSQKEDKKRVLRKIVKSCPSVLRYSEQNVKSKLRNLLHFFSDDKQTVQKVVTKAPTLLGLAEDTVGARMEWLLDFLDGDEKAARKVTKECPTLLLLTEENMEAKIENLISVVGDDRKTLQKIVKRCPCMFTYSEMATSSKIQNLRNFFENNNEAAVIRAIIWAPTAVFGHSEATLNDKLAFLLEEIFDGSVAATQKIVAACPSVLCRKSATLKLKADYLKDAVYKGNQNAFVDGLSSCHAALIYSLENRIKPRVQVVLEAGLEPETFPLSSILCQTEERFATWLENRRLEKHGPPARTDQ